MNILDQNELECTKLYDKLKHFHFRVSKMLWPWLGLFGYNFIKVASTDCAEECKRIKCKFNTLLILGSLTEKYKMHVAVLEKYKMHVAVLEKYKMLVVVIDKIPAYSNVCKFDLVSNVGALTNIKSME